MVFKTESYIYGGGFGKCRVTNGVCRYKAFCPVLYGPGKLSASAQLQVCLCDFKTIVCGGKELQSFFRFRCAGNQNTQAAPRAAPYASAKLVELRESITFGRLNYNYACLWHIYSNLKDRGADKYGAFSAAKGLYRFLLCLTVKLSMYELCLYGGQFSVEPRKTFFRGRKL